MKKTMKKKISRRWKRDGISHQSIFTKKNVLGIMHLMAYMVIIQQSIQLDWLNLSNLPGANGQEARDD